MADTNRLEQEVTRLRASVEELAALNQIATAIGSSLSIEEVNERIVHMVVKKVRAAQGAVFLLPETAEAPMQTVVRVRDSSADEGPARFGTPIIGWVLKNQSPLNISVDADPDGLLKFTTGEVTSALCVPMKSQGKIIGAVSVFNKRNEPGFNESDQRFLSIVAAQSAQVIEKMRYLEVEKNLAALKQELNVAKDIQTAFMPGEFPCLDGYDIHALNIQADEVGGDSFDMLELTDGRLLFSLGDVCGHGIPAALLMAMAQTAIRSQLEALGGTMVDLGAFVSGISSYIQRNSERNRFMTMFIGLLDPVAHTLEFVRAGHPPAILASAGDVKLLEGAGGLPLGVLPNAAYSAEKTTLPEHSRLLVYSDGVTELPNKDEEQFGDERLRAFVGGADAAEGARVFCGRLSDTLADFRGQTAQDDDITLVALVRKS